MIKTATALPYPNLFAPNAFLYIYVDRSSVTFPGPPFVRIYGISKPLSAPVITIVSVSSRIDCHRDFDSNQRRHSLAPSTFAASQTSGSSEINCRIKNYHVHSGITPSLRNRDTGQCRFYVAQPGSSQTSKPNSLSHPI